MQKLLTIINAAIAFLSGLKAINAKLQEELATATATNEAQAKLIEELQQKVAEDSVDDAELKEAAVTARADADAAKARADALQADIDTANVAGEQLAELINDHPETPNVDPNFNEV